jgi:DNA-binding PadR family transcriptional regulator
MKRRAPSPAEFLPLPVAEFHILVALADGARHGYGIMQAVEAESGGSVRLGPGTLYSALKRMTERGLIEETRSAARPAPHDERRFYYRVTALGGAVVAAETRRMEECVAMARRTRLAGRLEPA